MSETSVSETRVSEPPMSDVSTYAGAQIREHRLKNGLRVLTLERHLDPVVAVMVYYKVGALNERPEEAGMSHFLEHMMFKGTPRYGKGAVDRVTTELGGSNNAFTSYDHTAYWFELASDRWETALEIEADRMRNLLLDDAEFRSEKAVVLEELSMGQDDPWRRLSRQVQELLFGRHPYARPIIGYTDVLERATPADMRAYYQRFYHPANAILVIAGDVTDADALRAARRHMGDLTAGPAHDAVDPWRPAIEAPEGGRRVTTRWDDPSSRLMMAWPGATVGTEDDFVLDVVATLLSSGRLGRLYRRLVVEEGLATSVSTNNDARIEGGAFWLSAEAVEGVRPADLEAAVDRELALLADEVVPAAELKRAKAVLSSGEAFEGETISDLAEHVGGYAIDLDWRTSLTLNERRAAVTAKDVRRVVRELLVRERRVVGWSLPTDAEDVR